MSQDTSHESTSSRHELYKFGVAGSSLDLSQPIDPKEFPAAINNRQPNPILQSQVAELHARIDKAAADLKYASYRAQRIRYPETQPERWGLIFGPQAAEFEARFLVEKAEA